MHTPQPDAHISALDADFASTPYKVLAAIGKGGMGAVYEVEHRTLKRKLVLKVLREPNRPDLEDRLRFEAQTLAQLSHPNLLAVVDFARTPSGRPYLVCERLYGKTLKEALGPSGALSVRDAVRFASQALAALAVAHRAGVVHRDVKLDNLFLCDGDELSPAHIKVIDFGIAKLVGAEGDPAGVQVAPLEVPTAEGIMVGTPSFMSPEQITNQRVDHRADLYGIGAVLYRILTGRNPFICADLIEYAAAHATEIPSPPSRFAPVPPGLDAVVLRALAKKPDERFASAKDMTDALAPFSSPDARASLPDEQRAPESLPTNPLPRMTPQATQRLESPARGTIRMDPSMSPWPPLQAHPLSPQHGSAQQGSAQQGSAQPAQRTPDQRTPASLDMRAGNAHETALQPRVAAARTGRTVEIVALVVAAVSAGAIIWFVLILLDVLR